MMVQSDLYIHGAEPQRMAIVKMVMGIAERIGVATTGESNLNIPIGTVMEVLIGDSMHTGSLIGLNTEDSECVVMRVAMPDAPSLMTLYDALNQCYNDIEIEVDEDVENVPWPY
jgi:hypothetical protein